MRSTKPRPKALNHNHLFYFWLAAKYRSLTQAAQQLGLAQPTISAQIRSLEEQLKSSLLTRKGRHIDLTEAGQIVFRHADEMFRISSEIRDALDGRLTGQTRVLNVGTSDFVPKPIVRSILEPLLDEPSVRLVCREWRIDELLSELALFHLDLVLMDRPHPDASRVKAISHPVFTTPVAMFARKALARKLRKGFPKSLHGAPMYLPVRNTALRESLNQWFDAHEVEPQVLAEFEDRELLKTFGANGRAAFPAATAIESSVRSHFEVERIGWLRGVRETYYAVAVQRRIMHPLVKRLLAGHSKKSRQAGDSIEGVGTA